MIDREAFAGYSKKDYVKVIIALVVITLCVVIPFMIPELQHAEPSPGWFP